MNFKTVATMTAALTACATLARAYPANCGKFNKTVDIPEGRFTTQTHPWCVPVCGEAASLDGAGICSDVHRRELLFPVLDSAAGKVSFRAERDAAKREAGYRAFLKERRAYEAADLRDCREVFGPAYAGPEGGFDLRDTPFMKIAPCKAGGVVYAPKLNRGRDGRAAASMLAARDGVQAARLASDFESDAQAYLLQRQLAAAAAVSRKPAAMPAAPAGRPAPSSPAATPPSKPAKLTIAQYDAMGLKCPPAPFVRLGSHDECSSGDDCVCSTDPNLKIGR